MHKKYVNMHYKIQTLTRHKMLIRYLYFIHKQYVCNELNLMFNRIIIVFVGLKDFNMQKRTIWNFGQKPNFLLNENNFLRTTHNIGLILWHYNLYFFIYN